MKILQEGKKYSKEYSGSLDESGGYAYSVEKQVLIFIDMDDESVDQEKMDHYKDKED